MNKIVFAVLLIAAAATGWGQSAKDGPGTTIVTNTVLTNVYVTTSSFDIKSYDSFAVVISVVTNQPNGYGKYKSQWSSDNVTFYDEVVLSAGTASSTEQPYSYTSRVINFSLTNGAPQYIERNRRLDKWYRGAYASTNANTTGTVSIVVLPMNNGN